MKKYVSLAIGLAVIDLWTKYIVRIVLEYGVPQDIIGSFIRFTYVENTGMAFGLFPSMSGSFFYIKNIILSFIAIVLIVWIYKELKQSVVKIYKIAYSLVLAGALGNLIERIFGNIFYNLRFSLPYGKVVDFFDIGFGQHRWFIFNMADIYISVGVTLLCFHIILIKLCKKAID